MRALAGSSGRLVRSRRTFIAAGALVAAGFSLPYVLGSTKQQSGDNSQRWVGTWGTAQAGPVAQDQAMSFNDQTLRLIVHTSIGGSQVRIRLSNELGTTPLRIDSAHIAPRQDGASIVPGTDRVHVHRNSPLPIGRNAVGTRCCFDPGRGGGKSSGQMTVGKIYI